jgi:hypothetical protein
VNRWVLVWQLLWPRQKEKNFGRRLDFQREGFGRWLRESRFSCLGERPFGREPAEERGRSVCRGGCCGANGCAARGKKGNLVRGWFVDGFYVLKEGAAA